jgi:transposase
MSSWQGLPATHEVLNAGPLALLTPLLERLDLAGIINQHLPADPQQQLSHGDVLSLLVAARLCQPTALVNVADWAKKSGADLLWNLPVDKLNDDRLGRSLDAFFEQRHAILGSATVHALALAEMSLERLHFDTTHLTFSGVYPAAQARPADLDFAQVSDADLPPAHITRGYLSKDDKMVQAGLTAVVDSRGALPIFCHVVDGNRNGHTAVREQVELLRRHLPLPKQLLHISDRGTYSLEHLARLNRHGYHALCSVPWHDFRSLYDAHAERLHWSQASYLSIEQRRRRDTGSSLPCEEYQLAVLKHDLADPADGQVIPARLIFVYSSADEKICRQRRDQDIAKIRQGLQKLAAKWAGGHPQTTPASLTKQITRLLGKKSAAAFFSWQLLPLTEAEQAALPAPRRGCCRPTQRLEFRFDAEAAAAAAGYDGLSVLLTTAPITSSADTLFKQFKEQNFVELLHHQWKTPLAVHPLFLKSPRRVEALVCLLQIALLAYQMLERLYRQQVSLDAPAHEQRTTAETLLRRFAVFGLLVRQTPIGRVVHATRLTSFQRDILDKLQFDTPEQLLARRLPRAPDPHASPCLIP